MEANTQKADDSPQAVSGTDEQQMEGYKQAVWRSARCSAPGYRRKMILEPK